MVGNCRRWRHILAICPETRVVAIILLRIETSCTEKLKKAKVRFPLPPNSACFRRLCSEAKSRSPTAAPETHRRA